MSRVLIYELLFFLLIIVACVYMYVDSTFASQKQVTKPECYEPNGYPYPLCKGGYDECEFCQLWERYDDSSEEVS